MKHADLRGVPVSQFLHAAASISSTPAMQEDDVHTHKALTDWFFLQPAETAGPELFELMIYFHW